MPQRVIVLDDTDASIQYSGQWFQDLGSTDAQSFFGPTYNHTLHGTNSNSSFSFSFQGSLVRVWGTNGRVTTAAGWDPHWECFVDNITIGAYDLGNGVTNNRILCDNAALNDGLHEVTVNITSASGQGTFWLDYVHYAPSSTVSQDISHILVDNTDSAIIYGSGWGPLGDTANMTTVQGTECRFNFTGQGLSWFGFIPTELSHNASSGTYSIDGGSSVSFNLAGLPTEPQGTGPTMYNQVFFTTPPLPAGPHELLVVYDGNSQQTPLTLDYLVVTNTSSSVRSNSSPAATSTSPATNSGSASNSNHIHTPIAAIVGGVVGGVVVLLGLLIIFFCRQRREHKIAELSPFLDPGDIPAVNEPFRDNSQTSYPGLAWPVNRAAEPPPEPRPGSRVIHEDGGLRFHHETEVEHLPPGYSAE